MIRNLINKIRRWFRRRCILSFEREPPASFMLAALERMYQERQQERMAEHNWRMSQERMDYEIGLMERDRCIAQSLEEQTRGMNIYDNFRCTSSPTRGMVCLDNREIVQFPVHNIPTLTREGFVGYSWRGRRCVPIEDYPAYVFSEREEINNPDMIVDCSRTGAIRWSGRPDRTSMLSDVHFPPSPQGSSSWEYLNSYTPRRRRPHEPRMLTTKKDIDFIKSIRKE